MVSAQKMLTAIVIITVLLELFYDCIISEKILSHKNVIFLKYVKN